MRGFRAAVVAIAALATHACNDSNAASPTVSVPGTPPVRLVITGALPGVGLSAQFRALAFHTDGSSVEVTPLALWASSNTEVATVNDGGVVTGVRVGSTVITATYLTVKSGVLLAVQLPRTFSIVGTVVDWTTHAALTGATIRVSDSAGRRQFAVTNADGRFSINDVAAGNGDLTVSLDGYLESKTPLSVAGDGILNLLLGRATSCPTIAFDELRVQNGPFTGSSACRFNVMAVTPNWLITTYGQPPPSIQFRTTAGVTTSGELMITAGGRQFRFESVDVTSSTTPIPYLMTGLSNSSAVFSLQGTQGYPAGNFTTIVNPQSSTPIDSLTIRLSNPALPCCANVVGIDNIVLRP